ncbi:hypothetical protein Tco_0815340 [Tanacetum coccineum]
MKKVNFRTLVAPTGNGADVVISLDLVREVNEQLAICSISGMEAMLDNGPWLIPKFADDGLSVIATKLDTPLILDTYTTTMCTESSDQSSYARDVIDLPVDIDLKEYTRCGILRTLLMQLIPDIDDVFREKGGYTKHAYTVDNSTPNVDIGPLGEKGEEFSLKAGKNKEGDLADKESDSDVEDDDNDPASLWHRKVLRVQVLQRARWNGKEKFT